MLLSLLYELEPQFVISGKCLSQGCTCKQTYYKYKGNNYLIRREAGTYSPFEINMLEWTKPIDQGCITLTFLLEFICNKWNLCQQRTDFHTDFFRHQCNEVRK
jgi:hypothetical protein